jgi:hypothetical protein
VGALVGLLYKKRIRNDSANFPPALFAKSSIRVIISSRKLPLFKLPFFRLFQVSEGHDFHKTSAKHKKGASLSLLLDRIQFRLLFLLESILTQSADGALEVLGQILKGGAGLKATSTIGGILPAAVVRRLRRLWEGFCLLVPILRNGTVFVFDAILQLVKALVKALFKALFKAVVNLVLHRLWFVNLL